MPTKDERVLLSLGCPNKSWLRRQFSDSELMLVYRSGGYLNREEMARVQDMLIDVRIEAMPNGGHDGY